MTGSMIEGLRGGAAYLMLPTAQAAMTPPFLEPFASLGTEMGHCDRVITFFDLTEDEARLVRLARQSWASTQTSSTTAPQAALERNADPLCTTVNALLTIFDTDCALRSVAPAQQTALDAAEERLLDWLAAGAAICGQATDAGEARCRAVLIEAGVHVRGTDQIVEEARDALEKRVHEAYWNVFEAQRRASGSPLGDATMRHHGSIVRFAGQSEFDDTYKHDGE
ncbi:MAG: hypothetical protein AAGG47_13150 [Pseudomonadota bacterium]